MKTARRGFLQSLLAAPLLPDSLVALVEATAALRPTVLVSLGSPYLLLQVPGVQGYLVAWAPGPLPEAAAAAALAGTAPITGRLPIALPPFHPLGHGLQREAAP